MNAPRDKSVKPEVDVKAFWEEQARTCGEEITAVNFDPLSDEFIVPVLNDLVPDNLDVADIGCGNGRNLIELAQARPRGRFVGFDFAEGFVAVAEKRRHALGLTNIRFHCLDAAADHPPAEFRGAFDVVIGKRLLINVKGPAKRKTLANIHAMLRDAGIYIMSECFMEPLDRVNDIREKIGLERITVKSFNEYLTKDFMAEIDRHFTVERAIDIDSLYYFISRIFNAGLSEGAPAYDSPINRLAAQLVRMGINPMQGYSPEVPHVLRKRLG